MTDITLAIDLYLVDSYNLITLYFTDLPVLIVFQEVKLISLVLIIIRKNVRQLLTTFVRIKFFYDAISNNE